MMRNGWKYIICLVLFLTAWSCRKLYQPVVAATDTKILVVEGVIDPGADSTFIKLSHTVKLTEKTSTQPESGATVTVEGEGATYRLTEISSGTYASAGLNLNSAKKYHIKIHTTAGQDYLSDDVEVKITPPIDSLTYQVEADGLHVYSAAHDPANNTRYYRWDYNETWRFNSMYESRVKVDKDTVIPRVLPQDDIYRCYGSYQASTILLGSTVKLTNDVLTRNPVTQILPGSERLSIRYSIKLNQYALTKEAYAFWENLKKNTEQLGSIFDALPSELSGNIHNTSNANIPVVGFISISTVQSKRIYINRTDLPATPEWRNIYPYEGCGIGRGLYADAGNINTVLVYIIESVNYPITTITQISPKTGKDEIIGFTFSSRGCVDCTLRGTPKRPAFWTDI
jgi:hypothetical protein